MTEQLQMPNRSQLLQYVVNRDGTVTYRCPKCMTAYSSQQTACPSCLHIIDSRSDLQRSHEDGDADGMGGCRGAFGALAFVAACATIAFLIVWVS